MRHRLMRTCARIRRQHAAMPPDPCPALSKSGSGSCRSRPVSRRARRSRRRSSPTKTPSPPSAPSPSPTRARRRAAPRARAARFAASAARTCALRAAARVSAHMKARCLLSAAPPWPPSVFSQYSTSGARAARLLAQRAHHLARVPRVDAVVARRRREEHLRAAPRRVGARAAGRGRAGLGDAEPVVAQHLVRREAARSAARSALGRRGRRYSAIHDAPAAARRRDLHVEQRHLGTPRRRRAGRRGRARDHVADEQPAVAPADARELGRRRDAARAQVARDRLHVLVRLVPLRLERGLVPLRAVLAAAADARDDLHAAALEPARADAARVAGQQRDLEAAVRVEQRRVRARERRREPAARDPKCGTFVPSTSRAKCCSHASPAASNCAGRALSFSVREVGRVRALERVGHEEARGGRRRGRPPRRGSSSTLTSSPAGTSAPPPSCADPRVAPPPASAPHDELRAHVLEHLEHDERGRVAVRESRLAASVGAKSASRSTSRRPLRASSIGARRARLAANGAVAPGRRPVGAQREEERVGERAELGVLGHRDRLERRRLVGRAHARAARRALRRR